MSDGRPVVHERILPDIVSTVSHLLHRYEGPLLLGVVSRLLLVAARSAPHKLAERLALASLASGVLSLQRRQLQLLLVDVELVVAADAVPSPVPVLPLPDGLPHTLAALDLTA